MVGKPSETDSIKSQISSKTSRGKTDRTKRRHRRHHQRQPREQQFPASLTFNIYFYLFLYLYITRITINNGTHIEKHQRSKTEVSPWDGQQKLLGGGGGGGLNYFSVDQPSPLVLFNFTRQLRTIKQNVQNTNEKQSGQLALKGRWPQC